MRNDHNYRQAFTLIEILCVCIILAIAASITVPYVQDGYNDVKLSAASRAVMADIYYAQSLAITKQTQAYVVFTAANGTTGGSYAIKYLDRADNTVKVEKNPSDLRDYVQYLGPCADPSLQRSGLADCTLGTLPSGVTAIGFDYMGQPINPGTTPAADATRTQSLQIPLKSRKGNLVTNLTIQPFTGEMEVDKVKGS